MVNFCLELSSNENKISVPLFSHIDSNILRNQEFYIFNDVEYIGQLLSSESNNMEGIENFNIYLNESKLNTNFDKSTGMIYLANFNDEKKIFFECYGLVQFSVTFTIDDTSFYLKSSLIQVMVRKGLQNESIQRMTSFIYKNNKPLLCDSKESFMDINDLKTLELKVLLLQKITKIYEKNFSYFKTNSRFKIIPKGEIDSFEKLQYLSNSTIQYISQHPNELTQILNNKGIRYNNKYYQPNKTLVMKNTSNYDIYENRYVVNFLKTIIIEVSDLCKKIDELLLTIPSCDKEENGYVCSSFFIYQNLKTLLTKKNKELELLYKEILELYKLYKDTLLVKEEVILKVPKLTHIFQSIPQYRQIYNLMISWFKYKIDDMDEYKYMLSFKKTSSLYEIYVLTKLINFIKANDFSLFSINKINYKFNTPSYYENTTCNNLFIFKKSNITLSLYYQPVIYNKDKSDISGIELYRTTSISYPISLSLDVEKNGEYYTPDYLLKIEFDGKEECKYIIADAKFSSLRTTKYIHLPELCYKYLFSISPIHKKDKIEAMYIINGQSDDIEDKITTVFDYKLDNSSINTNVEILTLTENSEDNALLHKSLLRHCLSSYLK